MFIYLVTNTVNGKAYVGKTIKSVAHRWKDHRANAARGTPYHLYRAMRKYGVDVFQVQTLAECDNIEKLNELEKLWILLLGTHSSENGYNMTYGGEGLEATDEVREKLRAKAIGRPSTDKARAVTSALFKGKPKPLEQRRKMSGAWTHERKQKQAALARRVNEAENKKLSDYICPDCGKEFEQVTKGIYGGHRKSCLHWKQLADMVEEEMGQTLDEILESNPSIVLSEE